MFWMKGVYEKVSLRGLGTHVGEWYKDMHEDEYESKHEIYDRGYDSRNHTVVAVTARGSMEVEVEVEVEV